MGGGGGEGEGTAGAGTSAARIASRMGTAADWAVPGRTPRAAAPVASPSSLVSMSLSLSLAEDCRSCCSRCCCSCSSCCSCCCASMRARRLRGSLGLPRSSCRAVGGCAGTPSTPACVGFPPSVPGAGVGAGGCRAVGTSPSSVPNGDGCWVEGGTHGPSLRKGPRCRILKALDCWFAKQVQFETKLVLTSVQVCCATLRQPVAQQLMVRHPVLPRTCPSPPSAHGPAPGHAPAAASARTTPARSTAGDCTAGRRACTGGRMGSKARGQLPPAAATRPGPRVVRLAIQRHNRTGQ